MRDSRRGRLVLALLLLTAFTLITLDYRSGSGGPLRSFGNAVFGPVERAVSAVARPVGSFFSGLGHLSSYKSENNKLRQQNQSLLEQLRLTAGDRAELLSAQKMLNLAGKAQFHIVPAHVVAVNSSLGFEWTATIDVGSQDGIHKNQTVINGDGLVGKTLYVGPTTTTILLANDPDFTAGARVEGSQEIGHVDGGGRNPMTFTLLGSRATLATGERLVTLGDTGARPFVSEVPIGHLTSIESTPGQLFRSAIVAPYVDFTSLDIVSVVVGNPGHVKRDSLLPPSPTPSPGAPGSPSPSGSPSGSPSTSPSTTPSRTP
jgi:rod shape-determining protein MreC